MRRLNLHALGVHFGQHLVDDAVLHPLDLGLQVDGVQRHVVEVRRGWDIGGGIGGYHVDTGPPVAGLLDGPPEGGSGPARSLHANDDPTLRVSGLLTHSVKCSYIGS